MDIKLSSSNFRYFRYAKNRISNIDIFEISIFIENIDISHQPIMHTLFRITLVLYLLKPSAGKKILIGVAETVTRYRIQNTGYKIQDTGKPFR